MGGGSRARRGFCKILTKRIIPCLDVLRGVVVKGVHFKELRQTGDPAELAKMYEDQGADEIVFLDVGASAEGTRTIVDVVRRTAQNLFIPLTVGGGIKSPEEIEAILRAGADKVSINTAAIRDPALITRSSERFGRQCIVLAVDAKRREPGFWEVYAVGGREPTGLEAVGWARRGEELGAGEILLTSIDADGTQRGFDLELTRAVVEAVGIPVIASGGAGSPDHIYEALSQGMADAALAASIFHYGQYTVETIKRFLAERGVAVRWESG